MNPIDRYKTNETDMYVIICFLFLLVPLESYDLWLCLSLRISYIISPVSLRCFKFIVEL